MARKKPSDAMRKAIAPKKRGRKPFPKSEIEFKDGLNEISKIETISISDIDLEDRRFQYRLTEKVQDLISSLTEEGQLVPVILWGKSKPYKIIDGFRRTVAIKSIGWVTVKAIVHRGISEDDAYRMSFIENFNRKRLSPIDIANAIWKATSRGKSNAELTKEFNLSERQLQRYRKMIEFNDAIKSALSEGTISIAHAQVLNMFEVKKIEEWIVQIKDGLSAKALKKLLQKEATVKTKPRKFLKKEKDGFRLYPIRFTASASEKSRAEIREFLEEALNIIKSFESEETTTKNP